MVFVHFSVKTKVLLNQSKFGCWKTRLSNDTKMPQAFEFLKFVEKYLIYLYVLCQALTLLIFSAVLYRSGFKINK